jgi:hypothetical protein
MKAQRAATRAANKAAREASAARTEALCAVLPAIDSGTDTARTFVLRAMLNTAPWEAMAPAVALLGITDDDADQTRRQRSAADQHRAYADVDADHLLRAALAV